MIAGAHMTCKPVLMAACCQCSTHLRTMLSLTVLTSGAGAAKGGSTGRGGVRSSVANFYTDESPGIKFQPVSVHLAARLQ